MNAYIITLIINMCILIVLPISETFSQESLYQLYVPSYRGTQIAQDLPKRRDAEKRLEQETPEGVQKPKRAPKDEVMGEKTEDLPKRRDAPEMPSRAVTTDELEAISPDVFLPVPDRWRIGGQ